MEFPRLVYKSASSHKLVANEDELKAARAEGWFGSVPEAKGEEVPKYAPELQKEELEVVKPLSAKEQKKADKAFKKSWE